MNIYNPEKNVSNLSQRIALAVVLCAYFFIAYFLMASIDHSKTYSADIFLDNFIPMTPIFIIFYIFGDVLAFLGILFQKHKHNLYAAVIAYALMMTISFFIFWLYPVKVIRPEITPNGIFEIITLYRIELDTSLNAFPSLHVALGTLSWMLIRKENRRLAKLLTAPFMLMIISTLLVKQHVVLDAIAGLVLAIATYYLYLRLCKYFKNKEILTLTHEV